MSKSSSSSDSSFWVFFEGFLSPLLDLESFLESFLDEELDFTDLDFDAETSLVLLRLPLRSSLPSTARFNPAIMKDNFCRL